MTPKQRAVIERARQTPSRVIEIPREPRLNRSTAYDNAIAKMTPEERAKLPRNRVPFACQRSDADYWDRKTTELLEAEQQRLIRTWHND